MTDLKAHLTRQAAASRGHFGPDVRTAGILNHIQEEIEEVRDAPDASGRSAEWTDIAILGLDGLLRSCREELESMFAGLVTNDMVAEAAMARIVAKQAKNEVRVYPDWRKMTGDQPINHVRGIND